MGSDKYYYKEIAIAKKLGITVGIGNNRFDPERPITRQDMMVLTERAMRKLDLLNTSDDIKSLEKYKDKQNIADYARISVANLVKEGLIEGAGDRIYPKDNAIRAEAAVFLYRIYKYE